MYGKYRVYTLLSGAVIEAVSNLLATLYASHEVMESILFDCVCYRVNDRHTNIDIYNLIVFAVIQSTGQDFGQWNRNNEHKNICLAMSSVC